MSRVSPGTATALSGGTVTATPTGTQDVNVIQLGGVSITVGNGISGTGVQRVTIASDSTGQVTLAAGTATIGALTANQSVNVAQINGVAPTMGNGVSGTGVQRVTLASDSTGNIATIGTSITPGTGATNLGKAEDAVHASGDTGVMALAVSNEANTARAADGDYLAIATDTEGNVRMVGNRDHDAVDAGEPVKMGMIAYSPDGTTPGTAVAELDRSNAKGDLDGRQFVNDEHPRWWSYHENSSSALTDASVQAAPGAGFQIVITSIIVSTGAATALNFFLEEGVTTIWGPDYLEAVSGRGFVSGPIKKHITANTAVTITTSAAILHSIDILGYIQAV